MAEISGLVAAIAAAVAGLIYLGGRIRAGWRRVWRLGVGIDAGMDLLRRELDPNDEDSMLNNVHWLALSIGRLQVRLDEQERQLIGLAHQLSNLERKA